MRKRVSCAFLKVRGERESINFNRSPFTRAHRLYPSTFDPRPQPRPSGINTMDEEYDVWSIISLLTSVSHISGYRSRHRLDRVCFIWVAVCRGQEGPPHGQERLLWW